MSWKKIHFIDVGIWGMNIIVAIMVVLTLMINVRIEVIALIMYLFSFIGIVVSIKFKLKKVLLSAIAIIVLFTLTLWLSALLLLISFLATMISSIIFKSVALLKYHKEWNMYKYATLFVMLPVQTAMMVPILYTLVKGIWNLLIGN